MPDSEQKPLTMKSLAARLDDADARSEELSVAIQDMNQQFSESKAETAAKMDQMLALLQGMSAQDRPTGSPHRDEHYEFLGTEGEPAHFTEDIGDGRERPELVVPHGPMDVDSPAFRDQMENERFLREPVAVLIQHSNEEFEDDPVVLYHNGKPYPIARGVDTVVPRCVVEVLARAKPVAFGNEEIVVNGVRRMRHRQSTRMRYAFTTLNDSDRGRAWLQSILAQH